MGICWLVTDIKKFGEVSIYTCAVSLYIRINKQTKQTKNNLKLWYNDFSFATFRILLLFFFSIAIIKKGQRIVLKL